MKKTELIYLQELIADFPFTLAKSFPQSFPQLKFKNYSDAAIALAEIENRFQQQDDYLMLQAEGYSTFQNSISNRNEFNNFLSQWLCRSLHKSLFKFILSNAGEYRKSSDKNNGIVNFGGFNFRTRQSNFTGFAPNTIETEIIKSFEILKQNGNPLDLSIRFYLRFVRIHPFYDANGRIARLIVNFYLAYNGYMILWQQLNTTKNNEFIKRLNECHKRDGKPEFEKYFSFLLDLWTKFVIKIEDEI